MSAARDRLLRADVRLLSLVGPPGVGKTRLSLALAADLLDSFEHGVFFVHLAPLGEAGLVTATIATTLGLEEVGRRSPLHQLQEYLLERRLLLVLDNFEHILPAAAELADLLGACPAVKVLATSREPLRLRWEHLFPVPPLALPDPAEVTDPEVVARAPATALFVQRTQAANPNFVLEPHSAPVVAEICVRLDGLPLAIELAAGRMSVLPPQAILARLGRRLDLLRSRDRDQPARHRTLREAVAWSYGLLDTGERGLFRRLAVFAGGCTLEAAEAVGNPDHEFDLEVLDSLASLVDKSLAVQVETTAAEPRFGLLETMREFGLERLAAEEEIDGTRRRHAEYYLALAEALEWKLWSADAPVLLARLEREHDNFRAVLSWSLETGDLEIGLRLAGALAWFWFIRGYFSEGRGWLEQFLRETAGQILLGRAKALTGAGNLANRQGEYALAAALLSESLTICRQLESHIDTAFALINFGMVAYHQGEYERAHHLFAEALDLYQALGEKPHIARTLGSLGIVARAHGDLKQAASLQEQALAIAREVGHQEVIGWSLNILGSIASDQGDYDRAAVLLEESVAVYRAMGHKWRLAMSLRSLGNIAQRRGDVRGSAGLYRECLGIYQELGLGERLGVTLCLAGLAGAAALAGLAEPAARLGGAAQALLESTDAPLEPADWASYERQLAAARSHLDQPAVAAAWTAGHALPLKHAVAYALAVELPASPLARSPAQAIPPPPLSPREWEVAQLVKGGRTNREIAEALVIAERTAENHIQRIMYKLTLHSRAQIAVWATERMPR